jgi:hypothetical protein
MGFLNKKDNATKKLLFTYSEYLGGHSTLGHKRRGNLVMTDKEMGMGMSRSPRHAVLQWSDISSVDVSGDQVGKSKIGATLVFGVFGGLAAKGTKSQTAITVYTKDNQVAYYRIDKANALEIRAKITPLLRAVGVPFHDELVEHNSSSSVTQSVDVADQLTKLVKLKEQGIVTQEEFDNQKTKLLS